MRGSPYLDYASMAAPDSVADIINWSEYVMTLTDELGDSLRKLYACFNTPIRVLGFTEDLRKADLSTIQKFKLLITQKLHYGSEVFQMALNTATYGNDFISMRLKHTRSLMCKSCGSTYVLKPSKIITEELKPKFTEHGFFGRCANPDCSNYRQNKSMAISDVHDKTDAGILITHWKFRELEFDWREGTQSLQVYYRPPNYLKELVRQNDVMTLHDIDVGILEAAVTNKLFLFNDDALFHAKHAALSGLELRGLGLPRTLIHARPHWLLQLLNKQCQVLAHDYLQPIPYFTSGGIGAGSGGFADGAYGGADHATMANMVNTMVADSRVDPGNYYYIPGDVQFRYAAGAADQFVPDKLLAYFSDKLENGLIPAAILRGNISEEVAPFFLKLFEAINVEIPTLYNKFLWWFCSRVASLLGAETVNFQHTPISISLNASLQLQLGQASAAGDISKSAYLETLDLDYRFEMARGMSETLITNERDAAIKDQQDRLGYSQQVSELAAQTAMAATAGQQGQEGAPADPNAQGVAPSNSILLPSQGYTAPSDVTQMEAQAPLMAELLGLQTSGDAERKRELGILKQSSPAMHAMVIAALKNLRQQVDQQNRQQTAPQL